VTAPTPEQAPGIEVTHDPEIPVRFVQLWLCDLCLDGEGGQCHTPGCALWINRAPDISLRGNPAITILDAQAEPAPELAAMTAERDEARAAVHEILALARGFDLKPGQFTQLVVAGAYNKGAKPR
jgi:hypothetical protein